MDKYLMITTIANPDMLEDLLRAILDCGVSGSTVLSGKVYSFPPGERVKDEFEVAPGIGDMLGLSSKDGRAVLTIIDGAQLLEKTRMAAADAMNKFAGKQGFGYTITAVPLADVAGLPETGV